MQQHAESSDTHSENGMQLAIVSCTGCTWLADTHTFAIPALQSVFSLQGLSLSEPEASTVGRDCFPVEGRPCPHVAQPVPMEGTTVRHIQPISCLAMSLGTILALCFGISVVAPQQLLHSL